MYDMLIYALVEGGTLEVRYIGKSSCGLKRPRSHLGIRALKGTQPISAWLRKRSLQGNIPEIIILQHLGQTSEKDDANHLLNEAEIRLIRTFREMGFKLLNATDGGDGLLGRRHTPEEIHKLCLARQRRLVSPMLGKRHTDETCKKIKISNLRRFGRIASDGSIIEKKKREKKDRSGKNNHFFGKKHLDATREVISAAAKKRYSNPDYLLKMSTIRRKPIRCLDDNLVFSHANDAGKYYKISPSSIQACARGLRKCGKTKGKSFVYEDL